MSGEVLSLLLAHVDIGERLLHGPPRKFLQLGAEQGAWAPTLRDRFQQAPVFMEVFGLQAGVDFGSQERFYYLVLAAVLASLLLSHRIYQSAVGHALLAVRDDELAAGLLGIDTTAHKVAAFGVAAGLAGLAGSLFAHYLTYISPENFASVESILIVTMLIVGGSGNNKGAIIGAVAVWGLWSGSGWLMASVLPSAFAVRAGALQVILIGLVLAAVLLLRPRGLIGEETVVSRGAAVEQG